MRAFLWILLRKTIAFILASFSCQLFANRTRFQCEFRLLFFETKTYLITLLTKRTRMLGKGKIASKYSRCDLFYWVDFFRFERRCFAWWLRVSKAVSGNWEAKFSRKKSCQGNKQCIRRATSSHSNNIETNQKNFQSEYSNQSHSIYQRPRISTYQTIRTHIC